MVSLDTEVDEKAWERFQATAKDIGELIHRYTRKGVTEIISHHDTDGLSAAGVLGNLLLDLNVPFRIRILKQLDDNAIGYLKDSKWSMVIFCDLASSKVGTLSETLKGPLVILDHHEIGDASPPERKDLGFLNPHFFEIDGAIAISGAGVAYVVARSLHEDYVRLAPLAIVGAIGDRQNKGPSHSFTGLNAKIIKEGKEHNLIEERMDLWIYGAHTIPIVATIERLGIPGLSGVEIQRYLEKELKISPLVGDKRRTIADLTHDEKRKLGTRLIIDFGVAEDQIFRNVYTFPKEQHPRLRSVAEHATLLNSLGRSGNYGLALALVLGDRRSDVIDEAENLLKAYKRQLGSYLQWATLEKISSDTYESFYFLDAGNRIDDRVIGTVASILINRENALQDRPLLAIATLPNDQLKLSSRIAQSLEGRYSLATVLKQAMDQVLPEGEVGGHDAAAGATITKEKLHSFLEAVDKILSEVPHTKA